jgi:flagellar basal-body rod modification protein FlgD
MIERIRDTAQGLLEVPARDRARLTQQEFLEILTTELTHQSPFDPVDNSQLLSQLVDLQTLESSAAIADGIRAFHRFMELASASTLIGKVVKGISNTGETLRGVVERVVLDRNRVELLVGGHRLTISGVQEISNP